MKINSRLRLAGLMLVLIAAVVVAGCGSDDSASTGKDASTSAAASTPASKPTGKELVIAHGSDSVPGVNDIAALQVPAFHAAAKYIENELGGWGGRPVRYVTCDGKFDPAATTACANKFLAAKPVTMFGLMPAWGVSGLKLFNQRGIPSFNGPTSFEDARSDTNFALMAGGAGELTAWARYACGKGYKHVAILVTDTPSLTQGHEMYATGKDGIYAKCGMDVNMVTVSPTNADVAPLVAKALKNKPELILGSIFPQTVKIQLVKTLKQQGFPTDRIVFDGAAVSKTALLNELGDDANGLIFSLEFKDFSNASDPDMKIYLDAMKKYEPDQEPFDELTFWSFSTLMTIYRAAKAIGFDKFDSATLMDYMRTTKDLQVFGSREISSAPKGWAGIRQPYVRMVQYKDGKLTDLVSANDGWTSGYETCGSPEECAVG